MKRSFPHKLKKNLAFLALTLASALVLGGTLSIFNTSLNPGLPIFMAACLGVLAAIYRAVARASPYYRRSGDLVLVMLAWLALCTLFTVDSYLSYRSLSSFVGGVAFFVVAQSAIRSRRQWAWSAYALIAVCACASLHAWAAAIAAARVSGKFAPLIGTFVNPDTFSILPLIGLCLTLGLVEKAGPVGTVSNLALACLLFATTIATACRSSMLGFAIGGIFFIGILVRYRSEKVEKTKLFVGFPLILTFFLIPMMGLQTSNFLSKWTRMAQTDAGEVEQIRFEIFENGWKGIVASPVFGSGPGTFGLSYQSFRPPNHDEMYINIAHNDFLEMGVEAGVLGLVLWIAITWFAVSEVLPLIKSGRRPTEAAAVCAAVIALAVYSLFNFIVVQRPVLWAQLWVFGLAYTFPSSRLKSSEHPAARYGGSLLLLLLSLWSINFGYKTVKADQLVVLAAEQEQKLALEEAQTLYEQAQALQPWHTRNTLRQVALLEKMRLFSDVDNGSRQLELLEKARDYSPKDINLLLTLGESYRKFGQSEKATETLDYAYSLTPYHHRVFDTRLAHLLEEGDLQSAAEALADWTGSHPTYRPRFSQVLFALEASSSGTGVAMAQKWLEKHPQEDGVAVVQAAADAAQRAKNWRIQEHFQEVLKASRGEDLCLELQMAQTLGKQNGIEAEFASLDRSRLKAQEKTELCYSKLMQRWTVLALESGQQDLVEKELASLLSLSPNRAWARVELAKLLAGKGKSTEAAKILREGLERQPNDTTLLLGLAEFYETQGSVDMAISYYQEVIRLDPSSAALKSKVAELIRKR